MPVALPLVLKSPASAKVPKQVAASIVVPYVVFSGVGITKVMCPCRHGSGAQLGFGAIIGSVPRPVLPRHQERIIGWGQPTQRCLKVIPGSARERAQQLTFVAGTNIIRPFIPVAYIPSP
jgi:hypothetical protein